MPFFARTVDASEHLAHLHRLIVSRWWVLAGTSVLVLLAPSALDIPLPRTPLFAILAIAAAFNGLAAGRARAGNDATPHELFTQLLVDISTLSALVFFSGGVTNPLISLLLPPVAIAALTLPARMVAAVVLIAVTAYSALLVFYVPLPMADASRATRLHLTGMWLTFAVSALMIAWFVVRMTRLIRTRDAELAAAREQALRDERVTAIGTLAAGAAHELGTPLATMALLASELASDTRLPADARADVSLLRQQIAACKEILTVLSRRAGAERLENTPLIAADRWLDSVRQRWQALRPQASSRLALAGEGAPPFLLADPRLEQAVLNLLNNAANASPECIELTLAWREDSISMSIRDRGPGFPREVLAQGGLASFPAHAGGSGIGLMLTRTAIEQLGGRLFLDNLPDGGALACIELPLPKA